MHLHLYLPRWPAHRLPAFAGQKEPECSLEGLSKRSVVFLESCLRNGFDVHQAQVKLFLAVHPSKNTAIKCQYFSAEEPPASPSCALTSEEETHTISIQMRKGEKPFQTPVILPVTALIRRLVRQKRQTFVVHLSIPPHDDGTVQFLGQQNPEIIPWPGWSITRALHPVWKSDIKASEKRISNTLGRDLLVNAS